MKILLSFCIIVWAFAFSSCLRADEALIARDDVKAYINNISKSTGLKPTDISTALLAAKYKPNIIKAMDHPSTKRPWHHFSANMISPQLILQGVQFWRANQGVLAQVSKQYAVEPEIIVAILGIETHYGRDNGRFRAIDALSTAAFYHPRRAEYFQQELRDFFILAHNEKKDPLSLNSSYAGAMGIPQFMPSNFLKYAVNVDGSKNHDIWKNNSDAIASIANYLQKFGWLAGAKIVSPTFQAQTISTDQLSRYLSDPFVLKNTVADWQKQGIDPAENIAPSEKAVLFKLDQPNSTEYWLGFNNFYVITRYNKSTMYAMAVTKLGESIKAAYQERLVPSLNNRERQDKGKML